MTQCSRLQISRNFQGLDFFRKPFWLSTSTLKVDKQRDKMHFYYLGVSLINQISYFVFSFILLI